MKQFNELLKALGMTRREFAEDVGLSYKSMGVMLSEGKPVPKWAKSALLVAEKMKNN